MDTVVQKGMFGSKAELIRAALIRYFETLPIRVPSGYDDTTVFSPDGRIFQVEYAMECASRGAITVGLQYHDGVILAKHRRFLERDMPKVGHTLSALWEDFKIDEHIGVVPAGLSSDFILLKDKAIKEAKKHREDTGEPIGVEELVKRLAIFMQSHTTKKDVRPLGCIIFIGGVDQAGCHLFALDPSGSCSKVAYQVAGDKSAETQKILKDNYEPDMSLQEALGLIVKAVLKEAKRKPEEIAVAAIETETKKLRKVTLEEIKERWKTVFVRKEE